ncbi:MAG: GNAT family N-acetyltransferase [Acidimicrobiales bacterium]
MPYPSRWESEVVLADGGTMAVRPIRPDDAERIQRFHERQSPESIYFRFFSPRPQLSTRDLERFTNVDYEDRMAFVGLLGDELVGVARYDRHRDRSDAEVAFFIDDEHHGRGMATVLLEYLAEAAREAGITGFTASVLPQNRKMLGVFTQAGFTATSRFEEGVIEVSLDIEPTPEALAAIEARAGTAEARSVERLLRPSSIAVVGASRTPGSIGHEVFRLLVANGFQGPVYPVNRDADVVGSARAWRSVLDVPGELDLVVVCVPHHEVMRVVEECAHRRVQGLLVLTAGYGEVDAAGEDAELELVSFARRHGMRLIGPNALGAINTDPAVRMHATFVNVQTLPGRVGLIAQSGVIGAAIIDSARPLGVGISSFVAVGNKADVSSNDLFRYWQEDDGTDVVMCYLESFGNPSTFSRTARSLASVKPIVAVKVDSPVSDRWDEPVGWPAGATAAGLLEQTGIIRVDNLTQMLHTAAVLAHQPLPAARRVAVLTNSWGPAWLAVDAMRAAGLDPVDPVTVSNEATPDEVGEALEALYASGTVDAVLVAYAPAMDAHYRKVGRAIARAGDHPAAVTTVACMFGAHPPGLLVDGERRVPEFPFPEEAALALGRVANYAAWRAQPIGEAWEPDVEPAARARAIAIEALDAAPAAGPDGAGLVAAGLGGGPALHWLGPADCEELLAQVGLAPAPQAIAHDVEEAVAVARRLGYPVALKASGLPRLSKTEAGGVSLDVHGDDEVRAALGRMVELLGEAMQPALIQVMVPEGAEVRVTVTRHPALGDLITLSSGGAAVDHLPPDAVHLLPLTDADAERLIDRSPVGAQVDAQGPEARASLVDLLVRLSGLAEAVPEIVAIRLNPVLVAGHDLPGGPATSASHVPAHAAITDARIAVAPTPPTSAPRSAASSPPPGGSRPGSPVLVDRGCSSAPRVDKNGGRWVRPGGGRGRGRR